MNLFVVTAACQGTSGTCPYLQKKSGDCRGDEIGQRAGDHRPEAEAGQVAAAAWGERTDAAHLALTYRALHGFGLTGTIVVGTIVITGLINAWLLVGLGNLPTLGTTVYGRLLIAKLVLLGGMLGLASLNRFRFTPAFERSVSAGDYKGALRTLRTSLAVEASCVVAILVLVGWLGTLEPPASAM